MCNGCTRCRTECHVDYDATASRSRCLLAVVSTPPPRTRYLRFNHARCEDERHEIDMVLDNNAAAVRVLEPLAEEIAALKVRS